MNIPLAMINYHQLALRDGLQLTPEALREGLNAMKLNGFTGCVVVPKAWDKSLTAPIAAEIALELQMTLQTCGFLPGNEFSPHTGGGLGAALDAIRSQMQVQTEFIVNKCGGDLFCGPIDIGWKSQAFDREGYMEWFDALDHLAQELGLWLAIEPLNPVESPVPNPFTILRQAIADATCGRIGIQFDTGHANARKVTIGDFEAMAHNIRMFEFANVGRHPLSWHKGIHFDRYFERMHLLNDDCLVSVEPFDPEGVIKPLELGQLCTTTTSGMRAMISDANYLRRNGVMR